MVLSHKKVLSSISGSNRLETANLRKICDHKMRGTAEGEEVLLLLLGVEAEKCG